MGKLPTECTAGVYATIDRTSGGMSEGRIIMLTTIILVAIGLFGLIGFSRGARRGLIALAGTLMSAVLIDLWQARWSEWLMSEVDQSLWMVFLLTALIFLSVALLVGYGSSLLLPADPQKAKQIHTMKERFSGTLLGMLNGTLLASYLLRYATDNWVEGEAQALIEESLVANVLDKWLAWFILAMVVSTMAFVLWKGYRRISQALKQPIVMPLPQPKRPPQPVPPPAARKAPHTSAPPMSASSPPPPQPKTPTPMDQAELDRMLRDVMSDKK